MPPPHPPQTHKNMFNSARVRAPQTPPPSSACKSNPGLSVRSPPSSVRLCLIFPMRSSALTCGTRRFFVLAVVCAPFCGFDDHINIRSVFERTSYLFYICIDSYHMWCGRRGMGGALYLHFNADWDVFYVQWQRPHCVRWLLMAVNRTRACACVCDCPCGSAVHHRVQMLTPVCVLWVSVCVCKRTDERILHISK